MSRSAPPIGLHLARTARTVSRAFDQAMAAAGGSVPMWLIMISIKTQRPANQNELAEAVGIRGATLTHHLNAMEADGLVQRRRDAANRRVQTVVLTEAGEAAFHRMRQAAVGFDQRLRATLSDDDVGTLSGLLDRLAASVDAAPSPAE